MTRTMLFALTASAAVAGTTYLYGQGSSVSLQPTTPGTQQIGNANVSGRIIAGSIQAEDSNPTAQVIVGNATSTTGANFGGFFRSDSPLGRALYGRASALSGTTHGVWGQADSPGGRGVTGLAPATSGNATGVWGQTASTTGRGVYGYTTSIGGVNYGVFGQSSSPQGFGVYSQGNMAATGVISGNGSGLTSLNASRLTTGTLNDLRLSSNVALLDDSQTFTGSNNFTGGLVTNAFRLTGSVTSDHVLKTNSLGTGTWQRDGLTMPESDSIAGIGTGLAFTHTGTGDLSIFTINNAASVAEVVQGNSNNGGNVFQATMTGTGRAGYFAVNNSSNTNYALYATTNGGFGSAAIYARNTGFNGSAGVFEMDANFSEALVGRSTATTSASAGVYGVSHSTGGFGVQGTVFADTGVNVGGRFESQSDSGRGVFGFAADAGTGPTYGVYGQNNTNSSGFAVYANGDSGASGTKSFRIDHPFDPENKYLLHYSSESPFPQNFYNGNVMTDATGYAWVELPNYFAEINTNFKYQLTVVSSGRDFVQAMVSKKIVGNRFQIRTSAPRTEVSWEVKADRNDLRIQARRPVDVQDKVGPERGKYQHPEFYNLGPERGMSYDLMRDKERAKSPPVQESRRSQNKR